MRNSDKEDNQIDNKQKIYKLPSTNGCIPDEHPQQKRFEFEELTLDSCFDSGNMANAMRYDENNVSKTTLKLIYSIIFGSLQIVLALPRRQIIGLGSILGSKTLKSLRLTLLRLKI